MPVRAFDSHETSFPTESLELKQPPLVRKSLLLLTQRNNRLSSPTFMIHTQQKGEKKQSKDIK